MSALLPRATQLKVCCTHSFFGIPFVCACIFLMQIPVFLARPAACWGQVYSGNVLVNIGIEAAGTSYLTLSSNKRLGPNGTQLLAGVLLKAFPLLLTVLTLRQASFSYTEINSFSISCYF
jgi:hypothetical protein